MEHEKQNPCPCAAVAELKTMVVLLTKKVDENETRIKEGESKLSRDYTRLELITQEMGSIAGTMKDIQQQIYALVEEKKQRDNGFVKRVHGIVDDVIRWGILLLLGYVAIQMGLS